MDKNTLIGFGLIGALLVGMLLINNRSKQAYLNEQKHKQDSITALMPKVDSSALKADKRKADSLKIAGQSQGLVQDTAGPSEIVLENDVLKVTFSTKGAQPKIVALKKYRKYDSTQVLLQSGDFNKISYRINSGANSSAETENIVFTPSAPVENADKSRSVSFTTGDSSGGKQIIHQYTLHPGDYLMDFVISVKGADQLFTQNVMNISWQTEAAQVEKDHKYELTQSHIGYNANGNFDFEYAGKGDSKSFSKPLNWLAVKQQFFIAAFVAKNKFESATTEWKIPPDSNSYILRTASSLRVPVQGPNINIPLQLYYGPSDYHILKKYDNEMEQLVPYGTGVFSFVKYINRYFLLPVFDFLRTHIASMGIVILLITLLIRLITSPILYKSYLSGAKMKVLKPEVDTLKLKFTDKTGKLDQQAFSMEQMKLWKTAGVSPLGGCIPALLQIPIFMSLYYFFQSNIDLRGKSFLWASDLSAYDSIYKFGFNIPFYGDHISLFTLTAVLTSLLISVYSMSNMQDNSNPLMKYMPYIFPVILLGVFNNLPAALTWYYTVSNTITLLLQIIIQKYVINHEKILVQINENRKKPVKKSKLAERMEAMQESQRKLQEMKNRSNKT